MKYSPENTVVPNKSHSQELNNTSLRPTFIVTLVWNQGTVVLGVNARFTVCINSEVEGSKLPDHVLFIHPKAGSRIPWKKMNKFRFETKSSRRPWARKWRDDKMRARDLRNHRYIYISTHSLMHSSGTTVRMHVWIYKSVDKNWSRNKEGGWFG